MKADCLLDRLLEPGSLRAEFQPVIDLGLPAAGIHYLEGLVRGPAGSNVERPAVLFSYARRKRAEVEVDRASLVTVLGAARAIHGVSIGVNVHAATLSTDLDFVPFLGDLLAETAIAPERVVLELVEHGEPFDQDTLRLNLEGLRSIGLRLALDDFGTGQANCKMLLECRPHYVKIDRYFVHGCHGDPRRQAFIESLSALARRVGARALAEGVEASDDLELVRSAGIELAQGYLFARPAPTPAWAVGAAPSA